MLFYFDCMIARFKFEFYYAYFAVYLTVYFICLVNLTKIYVRAKHRKWYKLQLLSLILSTISCQCSTNVSNEGISQLKKWTKFQIF